MASKCRACTSRHSFVSGAVDPAEKSGFDPEFFINISNRDDYGGWNWMSSSLLRRSSF